MQNVALFSREPDHVIASASPSVIAHEFFSISKYPIEAKYTCYSIHEIEKNEWRFFHLLNFCSENLHNFVLWNINFLNSSKIV